MKRLYYTIALLTLPTLILGAGSLVQTNQVQKLPQEHRLKVPREQILFSNERGNIVEYGFADAPLEDEPGEIVQRRTPTARIYNLGSDEKGNVKERGKFYGKPQFNKGADGKWRTVRYATTTSPAFDLQTKPLGLGALVAYADTFNVGTSDAYWRRYNASFADARSGSGIDGNQTDLHLAIQTNKDATYNYIYRSPAPIDTSALPDTATISSALFYIKQNYGAVASCADTHYVTVDLYTSLAGAASDYNLSNWATTDQATRKTSTSFTHNVYVSLTLNVTGIGNINKTGTTRFGFRDSFDMDNTAPTVNNNTCGSVFPYSAHTASPPYLDITYSVGASTVPTPTFFMVVEE